MRTICALVNVNTYSIDKFVAWRTIEWILALVFLLLSLAFLALPSFLPQHPMYAIWVEIVTKLKLGCEIQKINEYDDV